MRTSHPTASFWNERYSAHPTVYGSDPNAYFKTFIDTHPPGSLLLPAEGEGRNALYAAARGWKVTAFDYSTVARDKALLAAQQAGLHISYHACAIEDLVLTECYDAIALIYVHVGPPERRTFHHKLAAALNPGGTLLLEAFTPAQLLLHSGGPKDPALLYDCATLRTDFPGLEIVDCTQTTITLSEGPFHQGAAAVVRLEARCR